MEIPDYEIIRTIGKGGTAIVYLATDKRLHRPVVLKLMRDPRALEAFDPERTLEADSLSSRERLTYEAELVSSLRHPNIVHIYEAGNAEGVVFIAMEYLEGGDLAGRVAAGIGAVQALELTRTIASALGHAHQRGVIHRDVKPENILFRDDGTPVLSDFGLAKHMERHPGLTSTGVIVGSPYYMSPEQAKGDPIDCRTDIYSLGVVLYEMLTGVRPFEGNSAIAIILHHLNSPIPELKADHALLRPLIDTMMAKGPSSRFGSMEELIRRLGEYQALLSTSSQALVPAGSEAGVELPASRMSETLLENLRAGIDDDLENDRLVLPSLPEVALRIRKELEQETVSAARLVELIRMDPALSTQLLRVANSAYYAGTVPTKDLRHAIVKLGNNVVRHVIMMLIVAQLFHSRAGRALQEKLREVWAHSILVAALSEAIARRYTSLEPDVAMLSGLIHDIGVMPVLEWASKIPHLFKNPNNLERFLKESHPDIGALVLQKWNFPEELVAVVREHEQRDPEGVTNPDYADVVALANRLERELERADDENPWHESDYRLGGEWLEPQAIAELIEAGRNGAETLRTSLN